MALVESYVVVGAGFIFLGFGGSRWTAPYVERYIALAVAVGVKLMVLYMLIGAGMTLSASMDRKGADGCCRPFAHHGGPGHHGRGDHLRHSLLAGSEVYGVPPRWFASVLRRRCSGDGIRWCASWDRCRDTWCGRGENARRARSGSRWFHDGESSRWYGSGRTRRGGHERSFLRRVGCIRRTGRRSSGDRRQFEWWWRKQGIGWFRWKQRPNGGIGTGSGGVQPKPPTLGSGGGSGRAMRRRDRATHQARLADLVLRIVAVQSLAQFRPETRAVHQALKDGVPVCCLPQRRVRRSQVG